MTTARIPISLHTAYLDLIERCASAASAEDFAAEDGAFVAKEIKGRRYWYFQTSTQEGRKQKYVGPDTVARREQIATFRQSRTSQRERIAVVSALLRTPGFVRPLPAIGKALEALARAGVFRLRGVLVGTVAYQAYAGLLGMRLPAASVQTTDIDIAQFADISIAVEEKAATMLDVLRQADPSFRAVSHSHDDHHTTTYESAVGVRVDFLTPNRGPDTDTAKALAAFGTHAQPLRFLDFLIRDTEPAVVLYGAGIYVNVPTPQRYAIHKLIVARRRREGAAKREKDLRQAEALLEALAEARPHDLREAWAEAFERGPAWRNLLGEGLGEIGGMVRDRLLATVGMQRSIVPDLTLAFSASAPRYDAERDAVALSGAAGRESIWCFFSREALEDHFGAGQLDGKGLVRRFRENRTPLEWMAQHKFQHGEIEEPGAVIVKSPDVARLLRMVPDDRSADRAE